MAIRGVYQRAPSRKERYFPFLIFSGIFLVITAVILFTSLKGSASIDKAVYHLPDEVPVISLPESLEDNSDSMVVEDLVLPYFNFTLVAADNTIEVSLPLITAKYGADFNIAVQKQLENLVSNTIHYLEHDICLVESMTYDAYLDQGILTILLKTSYADGQSRYDPWIYDLTQGGEQLGSFELTERLLAEKPFLTMDFSSFLWVTDRYIQNLFAHTYCAEAYSVPEAEMSNEQCEFLDSYRGIVREIPRDISNAFSRWIFPADGKVFLVFQLPVISNDWYAGFISDTVVVEIDKSILKYKDMVTPEEAVLETVLNSTVHVMGATDQSHAILTRTIFYSSPDVFVSAAASVPETDLEYMIESLIRHADEAECTKMLKLCENLKADENLSNAESDVIEWIINRINS